MTGVVTVGIPSVFGLAGKKPVYKDEGILLGDASVINVIGNAISATLESSVLTLTCNVNERYKGVYANLSALQVAHATSNSGDYALVDTGSGSDALAYYWDVEDGWVTNGSTVSITDTDALTEGSTNLYFTDARALAAAKSQIDIAKTQSIVFACSDRTTPITAGTNKFSFPMPYGFTLTEVKAYLTTAQASGALFTIDINEGGSSILSTKLTLDNTERFSTTASTPAVISDTSLANNAEIIIDIDQVGSGEAAGLILTFVGIKT